MNSWHDLRFAARVLWKDRLVTLVAVVTLALGIGANSTVFTCMNAVVLGSLPYPNGDRVYYVNSRTTSNGQEGEISYPDFADMRVQARSFESLAAYRGGTMNLADGEHAAERLVGAWMTANAFEALGQQPLIGRGFLRVVLAAAYAVGQRAQEIGVRMALGARSRAITWLVLRRAAWQLAIGLAIGLAAALGVGRLMRAILVQEISDNPLTYGIVVALFVLVTVVASVVPSRRATRLDPLVVLRAE